MMPLSIGSVQVTYVDKDAVDDDESTANCEANGDLTMLAYKALSVHEIGFDHTM